MIGEHNGAILVIGLCCTMGTAALLWGQSARDQHLETPDSQSWDDCILVRRADLQDARAPKFEDYLVVASTSVAHPKLDVRSNEIAREYPTVLRRALNGPANYAGHYTVAIWGCGSSCMMFAVIDRETGRVITPKDFRAVSGDHLAADDFLADAHKYTWGLRFKPDSKLLIVLGALDEDEQSRNGAFYYTLKTDQLVRVHTTVVKKTCAAPSR